MNSARRSAAFLVIAAFGLAACEEGLNLGQSPETTPTPANTAPAGEAQAGVKDVERPDIFSTRELALWDGRPSLGGVWVAHPDVKAPERAILTNETTGQRVAGALFRRERDNPGPRLQVSSDAAAALNLLAGQPTEMSVVAVRQEEIVIEPAPPVISDEDVSEDAEAADGDGAADEAAAAGAGAVAAAATPERKPRGNFLQRIFGPKRTKTPADTAQSPDAASNNAAAPDVETQTLDPVATGAAAAIARAEADDKPEPRPARATAPANSEVRNPFIQIGLFSVEQNAAAAAANLRQEGIVPSVLQGERDGKTFWRVLVGPVNTADDQAAILAQVKRLGYSDAFLTSN